MIDFNRADFFPIKNKIFTNELNYVLKKNYIKSNIKNIFEINDISSLDNIRNNSFIIISGDKKLPKIDNQNIIILTDDLNTFSSYENSILVNNLNLAYITLANYLYLHDDCLDFSDDTDFVNGSHISKYSVIDKSAKIGNNCSIGRGVKISKNVIIKDNVTIKNAIIHDNVVICDNTTIGSTGFGFDYYNRGVSNISPQLGIVIIDSNSHIGSGCCIDRGKIDTTYIGKNCMIDNLVHIAHNVFISDNACIAGQCGISGSVKIGKNITIGGQSGLAGHITIGDNVVIAGRSGVTKNIANNKMVAGYPAIDIKLWKKMIIKEKKNGYK